MPSAISSQHFGYAPTALKDQGTAAASCFVTIGGDKIDLMDISVGGYNIDDDGPQAGAVEIQTLTLGGGTDRSFLWYDMPGTFTGWLEPDEGGAPLERDDVTLFPGEGLWAIVDGENWTLKSSGEVSISADVVTPLQEQGRLVVNPTPVNIDAAFTYITGYTEEDGPQTGAVEMQTLTAGGGTDRSFLWYDMPGTFTGWLEPDEGGAPLIEDDVIAEPGQGFWVISDEDGFNFCWPKVEL